MIGDLKDEVTLLARQGSPDGGGGVAWSWMETATVPAKAESLASGRDRSAGQDRRVFRARITIRTRDDLTHDTRIVSGGRTYRLRSIRADATGAYQTLDIEEIR